MKKVTGILAVVVFLCFFTTVTNAQCGTTVWSQGPTRTADSTTVGNLFKQGWHLDWDMVGEDGVLSGLKDKAKCYNFKAKLITSGDGPIYYLVSAGWGGTEYPLFRSKEIKYSDKKNWIFKTFEFETAKYFESTPDYIRIAICSEDFEKGFFLPHEEIWVKITTLPKDRFENRLDGKKYPKYK